MIANAPIEVNNYTNKLKCYGMERKSTEIAIFVFPLYISFYPRSGNTVIFHEIMAFSEPL